MKLKELTPMLYTKDLKASVEFYTEILGFRCEAFEEQWNWAHVKRDNVNVMLSLPNQHIPFDKAHFTGSFYFYSDDVDAEWQHLKNKVSICYPIESFDHGMREFAIYDNNQYILQFGQEVDDKA